MSDILSSDVERPMEQPEHDLSKDMCKISVTTDGSDKTSPSLSDMPIDVVGPIIEKLDYRHQLRLRKVSKSLRAFVDKQKPACESIKFDCCDGNICIKYDSQWVVYTDEEDMHVRDDIIVNKGNFKRVAFDDLASTLKNPKLRLEKFDTSGVLKKNDIEEYYNEIQRVLESLCRQVSVKEIKYSVLSPSCLFSILPYLKPGFLEKISLCFDHSGVDWRNELIGMEQVTRLEQWKQAKELELEDFFDGFPMKYAAHFKRFKIQELDIDHDKFNRIKNFLSELHNFEHCILSYWRFSNDPDSVYELLGAPVSSNATEEVFHYSIPDSDYYFELTWPKGTEDAKIVKKKRESI